MLENIFSVNTLWYLMLLIYIPACAGLIIIVLLQKGKGVGFSGAFGMGGGGDAIFGPRSSRSLPQQMTYAMAGIFMFLALCMSVISGTVNRGASPELKADPDAPVAISDDALDTLLDPSAPVPAEGSTPTPAADGTASTSFTVPVSDTSTTGTPSETPASAPQEGAGVLSPNAMIESPDAPATPAPAEAAPATPAPAEAVPATPAPAEAAPATPAPAEAAPATPAPAEAAPAASTETPQ